MKFIKPALTLSIGGTPVATVEVKPLTKSATLIGTLGNITASLTVKLADLADKCGNVKGSICRWSECKNINLQSICLG